MADPHRNTEVRAGSAVKNEPGMAVGDMGIGGSTSLEVGKRRRVEVAGAAASPAASTTLASLGRSAAVVEAEAVLLIVIFGRGPLVATATRQPCLT